MASTPTFVGGGSDYEESTPWYQNKTLWIVGGLGIAVVVFFYVSSQQSPTGSTSAATTTPNAGTTTGTTSANLLAAMQQLQTNDQQILQALQSGQTSTGTQPVINPGVPVQYTSTPIPVTSTSIPSSPPTGYTQINSNLTNATPVYLPNIGTNPGGGTYQYTAAQANQVFAAGYNLSDVPTSFLTSIGVHPVLGNP